MIERRLFNSVKLVVATGALLACACAWSAGDEIQVYGDDINEPGESGLELHLNYVVKGSKASEWVGQKPVNHMLRVTPELSWGLTKSVELGLYVPMIKAVGESPTLEGLKGRVKYLSAPKDSAWYAGLNFELGRVSMRTEESHWNAELRPILGWRAERWEFAFNPILGWALSDGHHKVPTFEPAAKVAYKATEEVKVGFEHYASMGPINHWLPASAREQASYVVVDGKLGKTEVNFGVGRGWHASGDGWVVKAILGF